MLRVLCIALGLGVAATAAHAKDCETLTKQVESALKTAALSEAVKVKVDMLRARGEEERKAGNKLSCFMALEEAIELLNS